MLAPTIIKNTDFELVTEFAKPDTKKPEESAEKKPPAKNDEKDVFEK